MDDWHDYLRLFNLLLAVVCVTLLGRRYAEHSKNWNTKTRDYWFALVMWSVAGLVLSIEGIIRDSNVGARLVFILAASLVTFKGLCMRGGWGDKDA